MDGTGLLRRPPSPAFFLKRSFVGSFSLSKLPYKPFKGIGTRQERETGERAASQPAVKEELVASRCCCGSAAAAAAKIRYQMGERERD